MTDGPCQHLEAGKGEEYSKEDREGAVNETGKSQDSVGTQSKEMNFHGTKSFEQFLGPSSYLIS